MTRSYKGVLAAIIALSSAACEETIGPSQNSELASAFNTVLLGFNNTNNTWAEGTAVGANAWSPSGMRGGRGPGAGGGSGLCGGGLGGLFLGHGFGLDFGRGKFGGILNGNCAFQAASGRVVCEAETRNGLTINRSAAYTTASGAVQPAFDSLTTNTVNTRVSVSGTVTRRDSARSTVQHASDRTISGLAAGSTQRTVNGTSSGRETTTGTNSTGAFTAVRVMGDTIRNVVIPVSTTGVTYPAGGTVTRSMSVTLTYTGQSPATSSRREVVTYNGTATATVVITRDGVTQNCTLPLPHGRLTCSN